MDGLELRRRMMMGNREIQPASDGKIWAYYDVSTTESATKLLGSTNGIGATMDVDGADVTSVASYTFGTTGIHLVKFTPTNTKIQAGVFKNIPRLTELYIPSYIIGDNGVPNNNNFAISDNALLSKVVLSDTYRTAAYGTFYNCGKLADINLTSIVTCNNSFCQNTTSLKVILNMPNLSSIGSSFMYNSGITAIESLGKITSIPNGGNENAAAFRYCNLSYIKLPGTLISIGDQAFLAIKTINTITIPNSVTTIGKIAFASSSIQNVDLGSGIQSIGNSAWYGCNILTVTCRATTPPTLGTRVFAATYQTIAPNMQAVYVPAESVQAYKTASGWSAYASKITAIPE